MNTNTKWDKAKLARAKILARQAEADAIYSKLCEEIDLDTDWLFDYCYNEFTDDVTKKYVQEIQNSLQ